jgi:brefeldin A-resistance guanine nucleotide exchange factor 1
VYVKITNKVEAVPETIKNMLLVMSTSGYLDKNNEKSLWKTTWSKLDTWLPGLQEGTKTCHDIR